MNIPKIFVALFLLLFPISSFSVVHVQGYFTRNGTYVQPHYRSDPNGTVDDNWSTKGNINPYTSKPGTKNPYPTNRSYAIPFIPLTPASTIQTNAAYSNTNMSLVSSFGSDKVGVYKWDDECIVGISGNDSNSKPHGFALWLPESPNFIYIFPWAKDVDQAVSLLDQYENKDAEMDNSLSFIAIGNKIYELYGESIYENNYPLLVRKFDKNLSVALMDGNYFTVQLKDFSKAEGMVTIRYGLFGFSESVAAIRTFCLPARSSQ